MFFGVLFDELDGLGVWFFGLGVGSFRGGVLFLKEPLDAWSTESSIELEIEFMDFCAEGVEPGDALKESDGVRAFIGGEEGDTVG